MLRKKRSKTGIQELIDYKNAEKMAKEMNKAMMKAMIYNKIKNGSK